MSGGLIDRGTLGRLLRSRDEYDSRYMNLSTPEEDPSFDVPFLFRRFEMVDALTIGGSASVFQIIRNAGDTAWQRTADEDTFTAHDFQNLYAKAATPSGQTGAYGLAISPHDQPDWEIVSMQIPKWVYFELMANLTRVATGPIDASIDLYMGYNPDTDEANIYVYDETALFQGTSDGATGDHGIAEWDVRSSKWQIRYMEPNAGP